MRIYNTSETCKVYLHEVKEKRLKFPAIREHFGIFGDCLHEVTGHYKKISPVYQGKIDAGLPHWRDLSHFYYLRNKFLK